MNKFKEFEAAQSRIRTLDFQGKDSQSPEVVEQYKLRNSFGLDPSMKIHRIFQKDFYDKDVTDSYLTLPIASSSIWKDPLENPFEDVTGVDIVTGNTIDYGSLVRQFYALCWTERETPNFTDWLNFSHNKKAVRISTTVGKLLDRLMLSSDRLYMHRIWLTKVEYKNSALIQAMKNPAVVLNHMESSGSMLAASAAVVRSTFSCEDEVRLLFDASITPQLLQIVYLDNKKFIRIPFDWNGFVDCEVEN
ncbi:hypothetical protein [Vibrio cholerae]|uniref:hypothetical protein n=1 Tax=Vibrio cholerae TaxID=666 RepID=UPI001158CACB|nr:hypothetical protein [Vibrio cholerae]TQO82358.1 hypothetical protein FLM10_14990 [Vibrio cholerae]TQQ34233.1 hypothetical protein FLL84_19175 [Vibrio cholerae]TQQ56227.1 hypothetical protein FLL63_18215 [Vibrio cholerae]